MVQSERDKCTLQNTVYPCSRIARIQNQHPKLGNAELYKRPEEEHDDTDNKIHNSADYRDKSCAAEERKHLRELDIVKPVVQRRNAQANYDTAEYAHLQRCDAEHRCSGVCRHGFSSAVCHYQNAYCGVHNKIGDSARKRRDLFFLFRHAYCDAHRKQQRQVVENGASCFAHDVENSIQYSALIYYAAEIVCFNGSRICKRAAYSKQKSRHGQQRYRKHERTSDAL